MHEAYDEVAHWLLEAGDQHPRLRDLTHRLCVRWCEAGLPLHRVNLGVFALHPEMAGYAVIWEPGMEEAIEVAVRREDTQTPTYLESPIRWLVEQGGEVRFDLNDPDDVTRFPVLEEFREQGYTDYYGVCIRYGGEGVAVLSLCTRHPEGLSDEQVAGVQRSFLALRLLINLVETRRLAETVLETYLGRHTSKMVLDGKILRGKGEEIEAALWLCDLRDFTAITSQLDASAMIEMMNDYFDTMAEAIWAQGGEILKFMGDAMLVVFRISETKPPADAAQRAMIASLDALSKLEKLSKTRVDRGLSPLRAGIAAHLGTVIYGNIGASRRLDFTVMGNSVNVVARLQGLTSKTGEALLFSADIAEHLLLPIESMGAQYFKGVPEPINVYKLRRSASAQDPTAD